MPAAPLDRPLAALVEDLRCGRLRVADLAADGAERLQRSGAALGAYVSRDDALREAAVRAADAAFAAGIDTGALQGLPVSVKDLYGVPGYPTYAGTARRLPPQWERAGPVAAALLGQLAVVTGKTHTVELAFGGLGTNPHWPVPRNPWDAARHRVPGGSSAGAGVSLYIDAVLALGTDTAGSIRIPASMTGTVGVKTTAGRWPLAGIVPLSPSFDSPGLLARSAADAELALRTLDHALRVETGTIRAVDVAGCRLAICDAVFWDGCEPGVAEAVDEAVAALAAAGARVAAIEWPELDETLEIFRTGHLAAAELYEFLASELPEWRAGLDPNVAARMGDAERLPAYEYLRRRRRLAALAAASSERLAGCDAIVTPTVPIAPPPLETLADPPAYRRANLMALRNTSVVNLLGLCAVSMPAGRDALGLPVGLQLIARGGDDARVVGLAAACERILGTPRERLGRPPLAAG